MESENIQPANLKKNVRLEDLIQALKDKNQITDADLSNAENKLKSQGKLK